MCRFCLVFASVLLLSGYTAAAIEPTVVSELAASTEASEVQTKQNVAANQSKKFTSDEALAISQGAIGKSIGHYRFTSAENQSIDGKIFLGKPLIVSLIYTSCYHICPTTTQNLNRVVKKAQSVLGKDSFNVVTIGFDTARDTPKAMRQFANQHTSVDENWYFLAADGGTMQALTRDLGFIYYPSPQGFDHLIQASIVDKHGVVYRQVYGMQPQTPHFVEPIKELVFGEPADDSFLSAFTNKIKLFCTVYDPAQDRYYFNYSIFAGTIVAVVLGSFFITIFVKEWRHSSRARRKNNDVGQ